MPHDPERAKAFIRSLTPEQIEEGNRLDQAEHERQVAAFEAGYAEGRCYLCGLPFDQMRKASPCPHWLLRQCNFKKHDFPRIYEKYDYHNIAAFLRWCANKEGFLRNINNLVDEQSARRVIGYTVRWKNIEWTFDCSPNDLKGHGSGRSSFPHYHFQMRIDGRQFINFGDFHVPLSDRDLFSLSIGDEPTVHHGFGTAGAGMQEAVSVPPELIVEHSTPALDENQAAFEFSTIVEASDKPISGDELAEIIEEARRTEKSLAHVIRQRLQGRASIQTIVSPGDAVPKIAERTRTRKPNKNES